MRKSGYKWQYHSNIINVNLVKDVSVDFSVYKNPYNNWCQMSFSLSEYIKVDVGWSEPHLGAYSAPLASPAG